MEWGRPAKRANEEMQFAKEFTTLKEIGKVILKKKNLKGDRQLGQNSGSRQKKANLFYIRPMIQDKTVRKFDLWWRSNLGQNSGKKQLATAAHVPEVSTRACPVFFDNHSDKIILFGKLIQSSQY